MHIIKKQSDILKSLDISISKENKNKSNQNIGKIIYANLYN